MPEIAVVVLSYGPRSTLGAAVQSILDQDTPAEIVVVHSGGGDTDAHLVNLKPAIRVLRSDERLLAGAARNLGIAHTRAPIVAFLADDCLAMPGWLRGRLEAHREGADAVASALLCHRPRHPVALAAHLSLFVRRMPRASPDVALTYGASYARELFSRHGLFRSDIESGEDTDFHARLGEGEKPRWRPQVQTVHIGVETVSGFFSDQYARGRRMARAWEALGSYSARAVAANAVARTSLLIRESLRVVEPQQRVTAVVAIPLLVLGAIAYAGGAMGARRKL